MPTRKISESERLKMIVAEKKEKKEKQNKSNAELRAKNVLKYKREKNIGFWILFQCRVDWMGSLDRGLDFYTHWM